MRLIDAEEVKKFANSLDALSENQLIDVLYVIANEIPTVDAVPVIRCKDCKYWMPHTQLGFDEVRAEYHDYCAMHCPDDDFYAYRKRADDYCSWAERKEE